MREHYIGTARYIAYLVVTSKPYFLPYTLGCVSELVFCGQWFLISPHVAYLKKDVGAGKITWLAILQACGSF